jgi:spore germination protein GerM
VLLGTALAVTLAACGVPTGGSPHEIPRQQLPVALVGPATANTPPTSPVLNNVPVSIYLLGPDQVPQALGREVSFPAGLAPVLEALVAGPTQGETLRGFQSAIPQGTKVLSAVVHNGVATVDFSAPFGQITGVAQVQAVEQVVFTVITYTTPVTGVQFEVEGQPIEVPIGTGQQVAGPVFAWGS